MIGRRKMIKWLKTIFSGPEKDYSAEKIIMQDPLIQPKERRVEEQPEQEVAKKPKKMPNFNKMTKSELDVWAEKTIGLKLDRRRRKDYMINQIKDHINKEKKYVTLG